MFLSWGSRSKCCYAPIRMGSKKLKNSTKTVKIFICCKCGKKDVDTVEYTTPEGPAARSHFAQIDTEDADLVE